MNGENEHHQKSENRDIIHDLSILSHREKLRKSFVHADLLLLHHSCQCSLFSLLISQIKKNSASERKVSSTPQIIATESHPAVSLRRPTFSLNLQTPTYTRIIPRDGTFGPYSEHHHKIPV